VDLFLTGNGRNMPLHFDSKAKPGTSTWQQWYQKSNEEGVVGQGYQWEQKWDLESRRLHWEGDEKEPSSMALANHQAVTDSSGDHWEGIKLQFYGDTAVRWMLRTLHHPWLHRMYPVFLSLTFFVTLFGVLGIFIVSNNERRRGLAPMHISTNIDIVF
jgi:hypothetical protein